MSLATIIPALKIRSKAALGSEFEEINYALEVEKNSWKGNFKKFGVIPKGVSEIESVTRYTTVNQEFEIILTDGFINLPMTDSEEQARGYELQEKAFDVYKDLVNTKGGSPSLVILVSDLSISEPERLNENVIIVRASVVIRYRKAL